MVNIKFWCLTFVISPVLFLYPIKNAKSAGQHIHSTHRSPRTNYVCIYIYEYTSSHFIKTQHPTQFTPSRIMNVTHTKVIHVCVANMIWYTSEIKSVWRGEQYCVLPCTYAYAWVCCFKTCFLNVFCYPSTTHFVCL